MDDLIFALDIGTRTVVGLICKINGERIEVIASHVEIHKDRAMKDGQIHDIQQVANVVKKVKDTLGKKLNVNLKKASIAAAGRTLRTVKGSAIIDYSNIERLDNTYIQKIEVEALLKCKEEINLIHPDEPLYCVGYSVLSKKLNDYQIDKLEGQKGGYVEIEIIATFLPSIVVDSLFEVLKRVDLAIQSLTLEPIAAIEMAIPKKYRMLNLALVDIGAGTSDIAISKDGTIIGYGMVQKAGDKITEKVAEHYLIDFNTAEKIKVELSKKDKVSFTDVLGIKHIVNKDEFNKTIEPVIKEIVADISLEIKLLNGKEPRAIFCVGGGSQVEFLRGSLAKELNIPLERVVIRGRDSLEGIKFNSRKLKGPEVVTPLGIAAIAQKKSYHNFLKIYVNDKETLIFNAQKNTVAQGLFTAGISIEDVLKAPRFKDLRYTILGEEIIIAGQKGYPGEIYLNGNKTDLENPVKNEDKIQVLIPDKNTYPTIKLEEAIKPYRKIVKINGADRNLLIDVKVNGKDVYDDYVIKNGDDIMLKYHTYVSEVIEGELEEYDIVIDGRKVEKDSIILNANDISCLKKVQECNKINKQPVDAIEITANGELVKIEKEKALVVDVLDRINIDLSKVRGSLVINKNGMEAGFADEVSPGDKIKIYWD